jgi:hypothetical protein
MTYLFSVFSVPSVANIFFVPNAQLRPFIEGTLFCPCSAYKEFCFGHLSLKNSNLACPEPVEGFGFRNPSLVLAFL